MPDWISDWFEYASNKNVEEIVVALRASVENKTHLLNREYLTLSEFRQDTQQAVDVLQQIDKALAIRCEVSFFSNIIFITYSGHPENTSRQCEDRSDAV